MPRPVVPILLAATVASGTAGLIYELTWTRAASTAFGVSAYATSTVLAAFFGGLALGGVLAARWLRGRSPQAALQMAARVEVAVAVSAVLLQLTLWAARPALVALATTLPGHGALALAARFFGMASLMAIPTVLMGATFPLFAHGIAGAARSPERAVEWAYGANVLGAAIGCAGTAWLLLPGIGMRASVALGAGLDLAVAAVLLWTAGKLSTEHSTPPPAADTASPVSMSFGARAVLVGLTGAAAMAAEVVWARTFRFAIGEANPYRAFALTLTLVLLGMGLGSVFLGTLRPRSARWRLKMFGLSQLVLAALCVASLGAVQQTVAGWLPRVLDGPRTVGVVLLTLCALVLGLGFPLLAALQAEARTVGTQVGRLYAVSTVAGVVGSLVGGFVLLPVLGSRGALLVIAGTWTLSGALAVAALGRAWASAALVPAALVIWGIVAVPDHPGFGFPGTLLAVHDGVEATTAVVRVDGHRKMLLSNGIPIDGTTAGDRGALPVTLVPGARRALLVGFGTGLTAAHLLRAFPELQLDVVELDDNQADTAHLFGTGWLFDSPRFSLHLEDGRQFLLRKHDHYDVIVVDSWGQSVNQEFYNVDFFADAAAALTSRGVFYVKLPLGVLDSTEAVDVMLRSAATGLPSAWLLPPGARGVFPGIIGARGPLTLPELDAHPDSLSPHLATAYTAARSSLVPLDRALVSKLAGGRLNTDDQPYFFTPARGAAVGQVDAYVFELVSPSPSGPRSP